MSKFVEKSKRISLLILALIANVVAGFIIFYFWQPIAEWYWNHRPVLGVDFYNIASFVGYLSRNFVWQVNGWKYAWWTGVPLSDDYSVLHAYLILPLLNYFTLPQAIQVYMLGSAFLALFFSYLLFSELSKDKVLGLILAIAASLSIGVYGALVWGGSLPYFASQVFLPLTLWLLVKFFSRADVGKGNGGVRWFYLSALVFGLSFFGTPSGWRFVSYTNCVSNFCFLSI